MSEAFVRLKIKISFYILLARAPYIKAAYRKTSNPIAKKCLNNGNRMSHIIIPKIEVMCRWSNGKEGNLCKPKYSSCKRQTSVLASVSTLNNITPHFPNDKSTQITSNLWFLVCLWSKMIQSFLFSISLKCADTQTSYNIWIYHLLSHNVVIKINIYNLAHLWLSTSPSI